MNKMQTFIRKNSSIKGTGSSKKVASTTKKFEIATNG
jgi:hypothetical protein